MEQRKPIKAPETPYTYGKYCIGSIACDSRFRMWMQAHQGVFLLYPFGPLIGFEEEDAFLYFVYTYDEKGKQRAH